MRNIICPKCHTTHTINELEFKNVKTLTCLTCNEEFENPILSERNKSRQITGFIVFVLLLLWFVGKNCSGETSTPYYITCDTYATTSEESFDAVGRYSIANDQQAIEQLIDRGEIIFLHQGEEVLLEKSGLSYLIVRRKGETQQLWIDVGNAKQISH